MQKLFPKTEEIFTRITKPARGKLSHSSDIKTGKLNRKQYTSFKLYRWRGCPKQKRYNIALIVGAVFIMALHFTSWNEKCLFWGFTKRTELFVRQYNAVTWLMNLEPEIKGNLGTMEVEREEWTRQFPVSYKLDLRWIDIESYDNILYAHLQFGRHCAIFIGAENQTIPKEMYDDWPQVKSLAPNIVTAVNLGSKS